MSDYKTVLARNSEMEKAICQHLIQQCETNPVLKNDVESSTGKSVNGMMMYLQGNARKLSDRSVVMVEDQTVFNWAFDYWHDPAVTDPEPAPRKPFNPDAKEHKISNPIPKPEAKPEEAKKPSVERISLFEL